ncbi:MAG: hypothetical protein WC655_17240 [Candidatus Hydrogenedentales bacterium]|jgi:hypothetical protein
MTNQDLIKEIEKHRAEYLLLMQKYPIEIEAPGFRAVFDTEADIDATIARLKGGEK